MEIDKLMVSENKKIYKTSDAVRRALDKYRKKIHRFKTDKKQKSF